MSHQNKNERIYTAGDMEKILERLRKANKEIQQTQQLLWLAVYVAGGEVAIPHNLWIEGDETRELVFWDDSGSYTMHMKAKK